MSSTEQALLHICKSSMKMSLASISLQPSMTPFVSCFFVTLNKCHKVYFCISVQLAMILHMYLYVQGSVSHKYSPNVGTKHLHLDVTSLLFLMCIISILLSFSFSLSPPVFHGLTPFKALVPTSLLPSPLLDTSVLSHVFLLETLSVAYFHHRAHHIAVTSPFFLTCSPSRILSFMTTGSHEFPLSLMPGAWQYSVNIF